MNLNLVEPYSLLASIHKRKGISGQELLDAFYAQPNVTAVRLPPGYDDSADEAALLYTLSEAQRTELGFPVEETTAKVQRMPLSTGPQPVHHIRIHAILCANDDGSGGAAGVNAINADFLVEGIDRLNTIYLSTGIQFDYDPTADFERIDDSLLNLDFTVPPDLDYTQPETQPPLSKDEIRGLQERHANRRQEVAGQHCNRMVFLFCDGNMLSYDPALGWIIVKRSYAFSGSNLKYIAMPTNRGNYQWWANLAGHETGHYFHQRHTHGFTPKTVADAAIIIKANVEAGHPIDDGLDIFDGDINIVTDTPADVGPAIFKDAHGHACTVNNIVDIPVDFGGAIGTKIYPLEPDRGNPLSYFKGCLNIPMQFSNEQIDFMRDSIENGNRHHLIDVTECTNRAQNWILKATWAWVIIVGGVMLTPDGIDIIVSNPPITLAMGISLIVLGVVGFARRG